MPPLPSFYTFGDLFKFSFGVPSEDLKLFLRKTITCLNTKFRTERDILVNYIFCEKLIGSLPIFSANLGGNIVYDKP